MDISFEQSIPCRWGPSVRDPDCSSGTLCRYTIVYKTHCNPSFVMLAIFQLSLDHWLYFTFNFVCKPMIQGLWFSGRRVLCSAIPPPPCEVESIIPGIERWVSPALVLVWTKYANWAVYETSYHLYLKFIAWDINEDNSFQSLCILFGQSKRFSMNSYCSIVSVSRILSASGQEL